MGNYGDLFAFHQSQHLLHRGQKGYENAEHRLRAYGAAVVGEAVQPGVAPACVNCGIREKYSAGEGGAEHAAKAGYSYAQGELIGEVGGYAVAGKGEEVVQEQLRPVYNVEILNELKHTEGETRDKAIKRAEGAGVGRDGQHAAKGEGAAHGQ